MALVTDSEVKTVIDTSRDTTPFITVADLLVTEELSDKGLSDARLKQIELYLAAHFTAITTEKGGLVYQKMGDSEEQYDFKSGTGYGLNLTRFGQQAMQLDTSGTLRGLISSKLPGQFRVL